MDRHADWHMPICQLPIHLLPMGKRGRNDGRMDDWRDRLKKILEDRGLDMQAVSLKAGLEKTAVYNVLNRRPNPQINTVRAIAEALDMSLSELVEGTTAEPVPSRLVPVMGQVAAGLWFEDGEWDTPRFAPVPVVPSRYKSAEQKAYRVLGDSMNDLGFVDGSFVITVPYWQARTHLQDGDAVVVERREAGKVERTIKVVVIGAEEYRLEARSSNPRWSGSAIVIPRNQSADAHDSSVEVVGLVIGSFRPVGNY
jgi:SOS-response transcriptional repressor LexA